MTQLSILAAPASGASLTMSSREIAELVASRHDNVKRTIETLAAKDVIPFPQSEEKPTAGRPAVEYLLDKRSSLIVVAQLCPEFTARIVDRWQELEAAAANPPAPAIPEDPAVARLAALRAAGLLSRAGAEVASFQLLGLRAPHVLVRAMEPVEVHQSAPVQVQLDLAPTAAPAPQPAPVSFLKPRHKDRPGDKLVSRQTLAQVLGVMPEYLTEVMLRHGLLVRSDRVLTPGTSRRRHVLTEKGAAIGFQPPLAAPLFWELASQKVLSPLL